MIQGQRLTVTPAPWSVQNNLAVSSTNPLILDMSSSLSSSALTVSTISVASMTSSTSNYLKYMYVCKNVILICIFIFAAAFHLKGCHKTISYYIELRQNRVKIVKYVCMFWLLISLKLIIWLFQMTQVFPLMAVWWKNWRTDRVTARRFLVFPWHGACDSGAC